MKRRKNTIMKGQKNNSVFWTTLLITVPLTILCAAISIVSLNCGDVKTVGLYIIESLISTLMISVIGGILAQIISSNILLIKRNNEKLKSIGITSIGEKKSNHVEIVEQFGNKYTKVYPEEIKLFFITGCNYFGDFEKEIKDCLNNSECVIKILLVSIEDKNREYIKRLEKTCSNNKTSYLKQIEEQTIPILKRIIKSTQCADRIKLRFYTDEYRYNFKLSNYYINEVENIKCWSYIQSFGSNAIDFSVALKSEYYQGVDDSDKSMAYSLNRSFDLLWDEYESTEYNFMIGEDGD